MTDYLYIHMVFVFKDHLCVTDCQRGLYTILIPMVAKKKADLDISKLNEISPFKTCVNMIIKFNLYFLLNLLIRLRVLFELFIVFYVMMYNKTFMLH